MTRLRLGRLVSASADGQVEAVVGDWQRLDPRLAHLHAPKPASCHLQHLGRAVHPDYLMARCSVASGAASRIECAPARRPVEEGPDDGLLDGDRGVAGSVVDRCEGYGMRTRTRG